MGTSCCTQKQIKIIFKSGFKKYNNIHDINEFSITDDYFSPYVITTNYKQLIWIAEKCGLKLITKVPNFKNNLEFYVNVQLTNHVLIPKVISLLLKTINPVKGFLIPFSYYLS